MRIVIGSTAIKHHFEDFPREPKDYDVFSDEPALSGSDSFWHPKMEDYAWADSVVATPDELYTIKLSHAFWELPNGSWNKHMADLMFLRHKGCQVIEPLYKLLYEIWTEKHGSKKMDLTKEAEDFFKDAVKRKYDHDSLHYSVAYTPGKPWYEVFLKPGHSVDMDMKLVWEAPFEVQVALFREEVYATALERIVIPRNYNVSPGFAYHWALRRTITSLTRGRSARFIAENYALFHRPDHDYVAHHLANRAFLIPLEDEK
ncbi:DUF7275 domain-containing protein [Micromonospora sp. CB01531]|uniref:DUF7275 domain-containing protein n=1 Tax=Micromonospora sp. CB01531 TaxID=1718947 RepID=UPI00093AACDB|nr:hypothetical protein [Micromonospora sp. CB01531]OKI54554.1 hypothetical protein A6A27_32015 [Micromonospora sp. CB01531]